MTVHTDAVLIFFKGFTVPLVLCGSLIAQSVTCRILQAQSKAGDLGHSEKQPHHKEKVIEVWITHIC